MVTAQHHDLRQPYQRTLASGFGREFFLGLLVWEMSARDWMVCRGVRTGSLLLEKGLVIFVELLLLLLGGLVLLVEGTHSGFVGDFVAP
jgi:hypothetical protein